MKERPILFNDEMVRAILDGRKTQTRRIVKPLAGAGWLPETANGDTLRLGMITSPHPKKDKFGLFMRREIHPGSGKYEHDLVPCPYGAPGDRLWVRETTAEDCAGSVSFARYTADSAMVRENGNCLAPWWYSRASCPSIHMPRWASRILLEITGIRVERLQDVSETDAVAEGVERYTPDQNYWHEYFANPTGDARRCCLSARESFVGLWKSLYGVDSWDANPWAWVIEFKRINQQTEGE